jgi:hypothetical protein
LDRDAIVIPAGATVSGEVLRVDRRGLGVRHDAALLDIRFTELHLAGESVVPIEAQVSLVEEAREGVSKSGQIIGIHSSASLSTGVSGLFMLLFLGEPEFRLPVLAFKFLAARSPDAEIAFPAGTEMLLQLTHNLELRPTPVIYKSVPPLSSSQVQQFQTMLGRLPTQQTSRNGSSPSDLINVAFQGSQEAIVRAFDAAGWTASEPHTVMALYHMYHSMVQRVGYRLAAMTNLEFNGSRPTATFQKNLNTLAKRHHIRLWREEQSDFWVGAATEDIKYKIQALGMTHEIDHDIDNERSKVVNDLVFTGCVAHAELLPRPSLQVLKGTAQSVLTDRNVAALQLNSCDAARGMPADLERRPRARSVRAALAVGQDLLRSNPVSVIRAMTKPILDHTKSRPSVTVGDARKYIRTSAIAKFDAIDGQSKILASR